MKCEEKVYSDYRLYLCGRKAKFEADGKHYCGIHNPNKKRTKYQIECEKNRLRDKAKSKMRQECIYLVEDMADLNMSEQAVKIMTDYSDELQQIK